MPDQHQQLKFSTIGWRGASGEPNLHGYVFRSSYTGTSVAYSQYFRSGIVEAVIAFEAHTDGALQVPGAWIETTVVDGVARYMSALNEMGAGPPYFILLSLLRLRGYRMGMDYMPMRGQDRPTDVDRIILPDSVIEHLAEPVDVKLRSLFDVLWNAFGFDRSPNFDESGKLIRKR